MMALRPLSTGFLLEFAQKLVDRGEYDEAQNVLMKILKSEPENPPVKRLLKTVENQKTSQGIASKGSRPSDIASDTIFIQKNVLLFERRNRDLEFAIRKILQDNIFLYQTLSRRNHELLELRKRFFGYDDNASNQASSGSVQKTNEILNAYQDQIAQRDLTFVQRNQEISRIMKEVGKIGDVLKEHKET